MQVYSFSHENVKENNFTLINMRMKMK